MNTGLKRRDFLISAGVFAVSGCGGDSVGGGVIVTPTPPSSPSPTPTPTPSAPLEPRDYITVAFAGSSSALGYLQEFTGPASNESVLVSIDGANFSRLDQGAFGKVAGTEIVRTTGKKIRFLSGAVGGSSLAAWAARNSSERANLVRIIRAAGGADIILLQIGRNDAASKLIISSTTQILLLRSLIGMIRSEANVPTAMIFIGGTQEIPGGDVDQLRQLGFQRQAETKVAQTEAYVRFGFSTYDLETRDNIHQTEASQLISGARFAAQVNAFLTGQPESRGPQVLSARASNDMETIVDLKAGSATDIMPAVQISGFSVITENGSIMIAGAERISPTSIRLKHLPRGGTAARVGYALSGDIVPDHCLRGTGSLQLPGEPTADLVFIN